MFNPIRGFVHQSPKKIDAGKLSIRSSFPLHSNSLIVQWAVQNLNAKIGTSFKDKRGNYCIEILVRNAPFKKKVLEQQIKSNSVYNVFVAHVLTNK